MKTKLRTLLLTHEDLVPPDSLDGLSEKQAEKIKTGYDVATGLQWLGHHVIKLGVGHELTPLRRTLLDEKPDIVFNLLEEFRDQAVYDQNVVSYLELMHTCYTGADPRGLILARDKALSKKLLQYHRLPTPQFMVIPKGRAVRRPKRLEFPLIVKSQLEESSAGISQASVVQSDEALSDRVRFVHESVDTSAIVEQYIEGRELYSAVLGNQRLQVFPTWELFIDNLPPDSHRIATEKVKWDLDYQRKHRIRTGQAKNLSKELIRTVESSSKKIYKVLGLTGYARIDFRLGDNGKLYFLEANPNPEIAHDEEFASAAKTAGLGYEALLQRIVNLGLRRTYFADGR